MLYHWLLERPGVLTGDSFFHLSALGEPLDGLNLCGAGRVVCLIDPVGDVYACPFVIDRQFLAGNVRDAGRLPRRSGGSPRCSPRCASRRAPGACASCGSFDACRGGCMAAKFFTGLPLDGPDPECVHGHGEAALAAPGRAAPVAARPLQGRTATGRRCRCPRRPRPLPLAGPRLSAVELAGATWPQVEATGGAHGAGGAAGLARAARAAPARSTPTPGSPCAVAAGLAGALPRRHRGARRPLRRQRRARRLPGHAPRRARGPGRPPASSSCARRGVRSPASCSSTRHGGNDEALAGCSSARTAEGDDVLVWRAVAAGRRRACRADRDVVAAGHRPRCRRGSTWPRPAAPSRSPRCCPVCAPTGCGRYRPTACWAIPTGASVEEGRALLDGLVRDLAAAVSVAGRTGRAREPRRGRDGRRARASARPRSTRSWPAGWQVVARRPLRRRPATSTTPWRPRPTSRSWPSATATRCARWWATCAARRTCGPPWTRPSTHFGGLQAAVAAAGVISGGPAAVGDPRRPVGRAVRRQRQRRAQPGCRRRAGAAGGAEPAPGPRGGRGLGRRAAGPAAPERLQRVQARGHRLVRSLAADLAGTGITANAVCPGSTRGAMLDASAAVYGLRVDRRVRHATSWCERLLEPAEPAALIAWLCGPTLVGRDRCRAPGRRRA